MFRCLLFIALIVVTNAVTAQVSVRLIDEASEPIIGALVQLSSDSKTLAEVTDLEGRVQLSPKQVGDYQLRISYLGMETIQRTLSVSSTPLELGTIQMAPALFKLAEAQVVAVRARPSDPFAFADVDAEELAEANVAQDIPMLLRRTPGAIVTSDAGNGVGYTGIRIRGADATRINVTVNGVPLNDAESQGVFWVNMPDFISSTSSIQVQRGVGESTYGTGAFGANINLVTDAPGQDASVVGELAGGSFGTRRAMLKGSTGQLANGFSAEGRVSYITSEGFVDRASSELGSAYLGASFTPNDRSHWQLIGWTGKERTYQSWFGIPRSFSESETLRTFNPAGQINDSTFYDDQTDNYRQSHAQLLYSHQLDNDLLLQFTGHYTRGLGFYNEYRLGRDVEEYGLVPAFEPGSEVDLIRRLWLDNHFYGGIATLSGRLSPKLDLTVSAGVNQYLGEHYGTVEDVIVEDLPASLSFPARWYENEARKTSINSFAKATYRATDRVSVYGDMQVRHLNYELDGPDRSGRTLDSDYQVTFFNPKVGVNARVSDKFETFASVAVGQREPNRNDFQAAAPGTTPSPEQLYDFELGLRRRSSASGAWAFEGNAYYMLYQDQLVPTGRLNDVGEYERVNVDNSYRLGVEAATGYRFNKSWALEANVSLSQARIKRFEEFLDNFGTGEQDIIVRENTPLGFSPNVITNLGVLFSPQLEKGGLEFALWANTVSKQYLDNSGSEQASLPAYERVDFEAKYRWSNARGRSMVASFQALNLFDANPLANGYSYRYNSPGYDPRPDDPYSSLERGDTYVYTGYYPQAGLQLLAGLRIELTRQQGK